jgi:C-terminal processing protease CtpA/Prc
MGNQQCCASKDEEAQEVVPVAAGEVVDISHTSPTKAQKEKEAPEPTSPEGTSSWKITVEKDGSGVGLDINTKRYRYKYVVIRAVAEGGVLGKANAKMANADQQARPGDRILSVNGTSGSREIVAQLKDANSLELEILRVTNEDPNSSD